MTATVEQPITKHQINTIMRNCNYNVDMKNEWVQWVTGDTSRTSLKSITHDQAIKIMHQQTGTVPTEAAAENWAKFDKNNSKHKAILSMMYQINWTTMDKGKEVPDLERLSNWLKSEKCPVSKPLLKMDNATELPKVITAFSGIVESKYK